MGYSPLGGGNKISPLLGFFSLGEMYVCFTDGFPPLGDVNADVSTNFFSNVLWELKSSTVGFFPLKVPLCCRDFSLSKPSFDAPLMGFLPLRT